MRRLVLAVLVMAAARAGASDPAPPGLEVLEYLGQWQEGDEPEPEWVDPVEMYRAGLLGKVRPKEELGAKHEERHRK